MAQGNLHHHGKDETEHNVVEGDGGAVVDPKQSFWGETREMHDQWHHTDKTLDNGVGSYGGHVEGGLLVGENVPPVPAQTGVLGSGTDTAKVLSHPPC